jgi:hypothetical protein
MLRSARNRERQINTVELLRYLKNISGFFTPVIPSIAQALKAMAKQFDYVSPKHEPDINEQEAPGSAQAPESKMWEELAFEEEYHTFVQA